MKISVIIPTHNRSDALSETLKHLERQEFDKEWEAIVVNNNSTDDTDEIVRSWQEKFNVPLYLVHEKVPGAAAARNAGARKAQGEFILFIDNDILTEPDFLKRHVARLEENPGCWLLNNISNLPEQESSHLGKFKLFMFPKEYEQNELCEAEHITGQGMSMPRAAFEKLGGFDENFFVASGEDRDLAMRARASGIKILYDPQIRVKQDDWAGASIRDFCLRQRLYNQTEPFFWKKYNDSYFRINLVRQNLPPKLQDDGVKLFVWKNVKRLLATDAGQNLFIRLSEFAERVAPAPAILWRFYRLAIAGAIYRGFQEGLTVYEKNQKKISEGRTISE